MTIDERIAVTKGKPSGFDYLRIILASGVILVHSVTISYGPASEAVFRIFPLTAGRLIILPMFFTLSGFLVSGSLLRCKTLGSFLGLRAIRIYPALAVEVTLSALLIGPIFTTVSLASYFSSPLTHHYFLNMLGDIHYVLPGVFANNPTPDLVNRQLWTVPFELYCYVAISVLALIGLVRHRVIAPVAAVLLSAAFFVGHLLKHGSATQVEVHSYQGPSLVFSFLIGVSIYLYKDRIPWNRIWFGAAAVIALLMTSFLPLSEYIAPIPIGYLTVYLGLCNPARNVIVRNADFSYGLYLYGYAIQQSLAALGAWSHHWYLNFVISWALAAVFATLSWNFIEKPAMRLRPALMKAEAWWLNRRAVGVAAKSATVPLD